MKHLVVIIGFCILLGLTSTSYSAENENIQSGIGFKGGLFVPSDENLNDVWGSGLIFGMDYLYMFQGQRYGFDFGFEYFQKSTDIIWMTAEYRLIPITASFVYFPSRDINLYLGGGVGLYFARIRWIYSASNSGFGLHCKGGFAFGKGFFIEGKYSLLAEVGDLNVGGGTVLAGYRVKI